MRVAIVGAGLGGLCLAHGLRRAGIEVVVLERHASPAARPASYGIHLNADGLHALHACLPEENWTRLVETTVPAPDIVRFHDQQLHVLATRDHTSAAINLDQVTRRRAANRDDLRDALLIGLNRANHGPDDVIRWGASFERYEIDGEQVLVRCADGTEITADVLVGADGANSPVRGQRLPDLHRQDLGILNISGRVELTPERAEQLPPSLVDGAVNNVVPNRPGWMFVSTWESTGERYVVWAWAADRGTYPDDVESLAGKDLRGLVAERIAGWAPALRRLVEDTEPGAMAAITLRTMPPVPEFAPGRVTLLGDAIHNMTPMAGIGANTALRDADALSVCLAEAGPAVERIGRYEARMRFYANAALAVSTRNARNAATTARMPRRAFRTVLRLAEAVPPLKHRMFAAPGLPTGQHHGGDD